MTVAELIAKLKTFPQDLTVCLFDDGYGGTMEAGNGIAAERISVETGEYLDGIGHEHIGEFLQIG